MNNTPYPIKQMSPGEILDTSILVFRDNLVVLLGIALATQGLSYGIALLSGLEDLFVFDPTLDTPDFMWSHALPFLVISAIGPFGAAIGTKVAAERYLGRSLPLSAAVSTGLKVLLPILLAVFVTWVLTVLGLLFLIIPGLFLAFKFVLIYPAIVVERSGGFVGMDRSWRLTKGSFMKVVILYLVSLFPPIFCGGVLYAVVGEGLVMNLAVQAISIVMTSFILVMLMVTYFERRCAVDGFDMQLLAQSFED